MRYINSRYFSILILTVACGSELCAKDKQKKSEAAPGQDQITIEGHVAVAQGPITRFITTQHYSRLYVYAERGTGKPVILIDVTKPQSPQVLSELADSPGAVGSLVAVAGTAALASDSAPAAAGAPQTIRIMDFSDPAHPKVTRQFDGVTAVEKSGGLILLADPEGIWILSQHPANDPAVEAEYARRIVYQ